MEHFPGSGYNNTDKLPWSKILSYLGSGIFGLNKEDLRTSETDGAPPISPFKVMLVWSTGWEAASSMTKQQRLEPTTCAFHLPNLQSNG